MTSCERPKTAVILAAGLGSRLGASSRNRPKGFLALGTRPIIEESLERLKTSGIERVVIVTGHRRECYEELAASSSGFVSTVTNPVYADSGSMYSLYCARESVSGPFLLLESDLIYERRALTELLDHPADACILLSGATRSGDEVYVETEDDRLVRMSKDRGRLGTITGELVGISKISQRLFEAMKSIAEKAFEKDLKYDYETDCLVEAAKELPIACHLVPDLAWAEIDDDNHLERARNVVYPIIAGRDRSATRRWR